MYRRYAQYVIRMKLLAVEIFNLTGRINCAYVGDHIEVFLSDPRPSDSEPGTPRALALRDTRTPCACIYDTAVPLQIEIHRTWVPSIRLFQ